MKQHGFKKQQGFTLIEVLIVVAIIGIVASIGYPSYAKYITETRRSDAHASLLNTAQHMERCKATKFSYVGCTVPASQAVSSEGFYDITLENAPTARKFAITATAKGAQLSDSNCRAIALTEDGSKLPPNCW